MANSFYKPIINIPDTTSGFDVFGTKGLFDDINKTNQQINSMNIPQPKPKNPYRQQNIGNMLLAFSDVLKGRDPSAGVMQRKAMLDAQKKEAERKADIEAFLKNNPQFRQAYELKEKLGIDIPDRKIIKGADGFNYYMDGTRVLPNVNQKTDPDIDKTKFANADKLRDEHQKLSGTFIDVRDAYGRILTSAEEQTAASDLSLIFNYMKMLDPGSVVREGEFANAQNSAGVPSRIRARYNNVVSGERLAEDTRADFINQAQGLYKTQLASQSDLDKNYQDLATSYGLDSDQVVIDFGSPIAKKEFKYNISVMTIEDLASLDESQFTEEQKKIIEEEMKKRLPK